MKESSENNHEISHRTLKQIEIRLLRIRNNAYSIKPDELWYVSDILVALIRNIPGDIEMEDWMNEREKR
jgi:hypothetical protein